MLAAVVYLHSQNVVHCDLRAKNIIDFGSGGDFQPGRIRLTGFERAHSAGSAVGPISPEICAPEAATAFFQGSTATVRLAGARCP